MDVWVCREGRVGQGAPRRRVGQVEATAVEALGQEQCRQVLEAVLCHVQREPLDGPTVWSFGLEQADTPPVQEHAVYTQAAAFADLHGLIHALVRATAKGAHGHRPWADDETPTGAAGASALALADRRWIPAYLQYLRECDLDHEVDQAGELDAIIAAYGWSQDTCALAAARLGGCAGQWGQEQVEGWREEGLDDYLETSAGRQAFLAAVRGELEWLLPDPPPDRADGRDRACFDSDVDCLIESLESCLEPAELEALRLHADGCWGRRAVS
jgi:hypothetical protein